MFRLLLDTRRSVQRRPLHVLYQHHIQHRSFHISPPTHKSASDELEPDSRTEQGPHNVSSSSSDFTTPSEQDKIAPDVTYTQSLHEDPAGAEIIPPSPQNQLWTQSSLEAWRSAQKAGGKPKSPNTMSRRRMESRAEGIAIKEEKRAKLIREEEEKRESRAQEEEIKAKKQETILRLKAQKLESARRIRILNTSAATLIAREERATRARLAREAKAQKKAENLQARELAKQAKQESKARGEAKKSAAQAKRDEIARMKSKLPPMEAEKFLEWAFAKTGEFGVRAEGRKADNRRINITSQSLANDVLERMKPSLEKHKGCDIIDINPGVGVWSATLHDYLKPRKHILFEPDAQLYNPLLKPLLDAPDSKYTLVPKSGVIWRHLEDVLTETHLPFQKVLKPGDPRLNQPNDTLLLVASLGFYPRVRFRGFASFSQLVLHQLVGSIRSQTLLQKYGQVRMLIWIGDNEALKALPKSISNRRKSSIDAEISCDMREIAASTASASRSDSGLIISNTLKVMERMASAGITIPPGRESDAMGLVKESPIVAEENTPPESEKMSEEGNKTPEARKTRALINNFRIKFKELEDDFLNGKFKENIDLPQSTVEAGQEIMEGLRWTPEYALLQLRRRQYESGNIVNLKAQGMAEETVTVMGLEREHFLAPKGEEDKNTIIARGQALLDRVDDTGEHVAKSYKSFIDNALAGTMKPPMLVWDRREAEPLKVHLNEFYPKQEMTLLDLEPKPMWSILRENYPENLETFDYIVSQLMMVPVQPLKKGLESLAPGAFEWMVEHCPLLTDPTQGGSFNPADIRIRMLTAGMLKQIIEAWMAWPFRPSKYELIAKAGSDIWDPATEIEEQL